VSVPSTATERVKLATSDRASHAAARAVPEEMADVVGTEHLEDWLGRLLSKLT